MTKEEEQRYKEMLRAIDRLRDELQTIFAKMGSIRGHIMDVLELTKQP